MPSERRLHPASILFALSGTLKAFALPAVLLLISGLRGASEDGGWRLWLLFLGALAVIPAVIRYFTFRLTYEDTELVIRSGLFFRNERHVPYDRIQNLDATRSVLHRALGVADVRLETGGGQEPEARISVLRESEFEDMRQRVFAGRSRAHGASAAPESEVRGVATTDVGESPVAVDETGAGVPVPAHTLLQLPLRELMLLGLLDNRGFLLILAAYGVLWESGLQGVVWERLTATMSAPGLVSATWKGLMEGQLPSLTLVALMAGGLLALVLFVRVLSMVWVAVTLHDFRLTRTGNDLRTEYGLLTRVTATIPRGRVQSLTVVESPLQRWCGRASVRVQTAGGSGGAEGGPKRPRERLAPIVRATAVPELVREVLPQADLARFEWQPLHPRAASRAVKPLIAMIVVTALGLMALTGGRYWPAVLVYLMIGVAAAVPITRRQVQRTAWALDEHVVAFRSGWLWRSVTLAPAAKIQTVTTSESPFDRRTAMAAVRIDTAGGSELSDRVRVPFLARETAAALASNLSSRAAASEFRW